MDAETMVDVEFFSLEYSQEHPKFKEVGKHLASMRLPWSVVKESKDFRLGDHVYGLIRWYVNVDPLRVVVFLDPYGGTYPVIGAASVEISKVLVETIDL